MTHNDAEPSLVDDGPATRQLGHVPLQSDDNAPPPPPARPYRRRKLPVATLVLALLAAGGIGFYSGVRVEKGQLKSSNTTRSAANGFGLGNTTSARAGSRSTPSQAANGAPGNGFTGGTALGGATATTGASANIIGTVTVVEGNTLYVTETNGDTVKVTTTDGTTVTKTVTGTVKDLAPGESVVIRGVQSSEGVYAAQSVTQGSATAALGGAFGGSFGGRGGRSGATTSPTAAPRQ